MDRASAKQWLIGMSRESKFEPFVDLYIQIREDLSVNWGEWNRPGFRAVAVHRFGAMLKNRKRGVLWRLLTVLYRFMFRYVRNHYGIELPATTIVGRRLSIGHQNGIVIHPHAVIGDDCVILQGCTLGGSTRARVNQAPKLGNRVELGANVVIIGNVVIGDDVRIGPNVTVVTNIPSGTSVFTSPPRLIKPATVPVEQFRPSLAKVAKITSQIPPGSADDPMIQKNDSQG